ncbi:MAG: hypothetical protein AAFO84_13105 [Cyanobacteria bacterium J06598_1]
MKMAEKRCGLGFSCALMMQQLELRVEDCPNLSVCGVAQRLEPDVEFELICAGSSGVTPITTTRRAAAVMMLMHRGCPQSVDSFGLDAQIAALTTELSQLTEEIAQYDGHYIAPADVEAVAYSVKRPRGVTQTPEGKTVQQYAVYWYNKLMSQTAIFAPAERDRPVKVIHLSKSDDPRNLEGRQGLERRNQLNQIATQLQIAESAIAKARELASGAEEVREP